MNAARTTRKTSPQPMAPPGAAEVTEVVFPIVGIGASAGGLSAFEAFFSGMPADSDPGMAFVLVQHLAPDHKSILADLIRRYTRMQVFEVEDGMPVRVNCAYIIPATFIWVREHVIGTGRHVHILLHCPLEYQAEFKKRAKQKWVLLAGMDKADRDTLHFERIGPRGYAEGPASTRDRQKYLNQLKGSLKYHLKGIDPDQALPRVTGDNRPIAELLGIEPEGNQPIYGRRASQSQNISRGARERYAAGKQQSEATTANQ
jgi:hypothetical protein